MYDLLLSGFYGAYVSGGRKSSKRLPRLLDMQQQVNDKPFALTCDYKIGDTVQLKSGGPTMTIDKLRGTEATCVFFANFEFKQLQFHIDGLTRLS
jgi:uncharacterized protein YodC (DUF2158 family)